MIKVSHLYKTFNHQPVLRDIHFEVDEGEIVFILGQSGSGKSVLLQHLIGLLKPDSGSVEINGVDITGLPERALLPIRKDIGYLFQEGALYDFMTVYENLAFPLYEHTRMKPKDIYDKVQVILETVGLKEAQGKYPSELSGGMKKRAALARSIILDSKILLCDEPTSGLDPIRSREISNLIKDVSRPLNATTIVTSHDIPNSFRIADRIILIRDGEIIAQGAPQDLRVSQDVFIKEFIT